MLILPSFLPQAVWARTDYDQPVTKKVMIIDFNPILESQGGVRLRQYKNWNDPANLETQYMADISEASAGFANYKVVERLEIDDIPVKTDGFHYTDTSYHDCLSNSTNCHADTGNGLFADYLRILSDYDVCGKRNRGEIDELWMWGGPYFGYYESIMTGPNAFWTNGGPLTGSLCTKQLNIMGFNYERGVAEMLEDMGHRVEGTMTYVYGSWQPLETHNWNRFSLRDIDIASRAGCGNVHYGPNSTSDYDWGNPRVVTSNCEDWANYPGLTGATQQFGCERWGCSGYGFEKWWLGHIPKYTGNGIDGKLNNWWLYVIDYEEALRQEMCNTHSTVASCDATNGQCAWYYCANAGTGGCYPTGTDTSSVCVSGVPQVVGVDAPRCVTSGNEYTITNTYQDPDGANDIETAFLLINSTTSGDARIAPVGALKAYLVPQFNAIAVKSADDITWDLVNSSNGYGTINKTATTFSRVGNTLTVNWYVKFENTWAVEQANIYLRAIDARQQDTGYQDKADVSINTCTPLPTPTPTYTISDLRTLLFNYLTSSDSLYKPVDGKVNMLDGGYVIRWRGF